MSQSKTTATKNWTIGQLFSPAMELINKKTWLLFQGSLILTIIFVLINLLSSRINQFTFFDIDNLHRSLANLFQVLPAISSGISLLSLVASLIEIGLYRYYGRLMHHQTAPLKKVWQNWARFGHLILWQLLIGAVVVAVAIFLVLLVALLSLILPTGAIVAISITLVLAFCAAAFYFSVRFSFVIMIIAIAPDYQVIPALKASWQLTRGQFWHLFGYTLLVSLINGVGNWLWSLPTIFTHPLTTLSRLNLYETLTNQPIEISD